MSEKNPTLQDIWRLLGAMNKRIGVMDKRFDAIERELVAFKADIAGQITALKADVSGRIGVLKDSIEARDFRLDEHGRRLSRLEESSGQ
jgi:hypothetical protein